MDISNQYSLEEGKEMKSFVWLFLLNNNKEPFVFKDVGSYIFLEAQSIELMWFALYPWCWTQAQFPWIFMEWITGMC